MLATGGRQARCAMRWKPTERVRHHLRRPNAGRREPRPNERQKHSSSDTPPSSDQGPCLHRRISTTGACKAKLGRSVRCHPRQFHRTFTRSIPVPRGGEGRVLWWRREEMDGDDVNEGVGWPGVVNDGQRDDWPSGGWWSGWCSPCSVTEAPRTSLGPRRLRCFPPINCWTSVFAHGEIDVDEYKARRGVLRSRH